MERETFDSSYDVIVVGAGHAGIEAALAAARSGCSTLMATINADNVGQMSCNPAIGGIGKGHLVREVDALGGEMGRAIDECGIQFRRLNTRKGAAVQARRAQADKARYRARMKRVVESTANLTLRQLEVVGILQEDGEVCGVVTELGERIGARAVVLTTGTFMEGLMHSGAERRSGGRAGDRASRGLSASLRGLGFELGRLKTGTCPRLDARSIDYGRLKEQPGDVPPRVFSFDGVAPPLEQVPCHITYTNSETHRVIRESIDLSPMYNGSIASRGPRYCPSIEDKVMKFPEREAHRIFLEPEGLDTCEVYPNGLSTALPLHVQKRFVATIEGLERAVIVRPGYAIEYDYVLPTQLASTLETKSLARLFLAGQINGTTGYEEAAAQGLLAGLNAVAAVRGEDALVLGRSEAYIGVMIDDLVTRGVDGEPYRMFTSRAEFRLLLREGNADLRLRVHALARGLLTESRAEALAVKGKTFAETSALLRARKIRPTAEVNARLRGAGADALAAPCSAFELLGHPGVDPALVASLAELPGGMPADAELVEELATEARYQGYIDRQNRSVERMRKMEETTLPSDLNYGAVTGLSSEAGEKLAVLRPRSLGQASRISGVTPAALSALALHLKLKRAG